MLLSFWKDVGAVTEVLILELAASYVVSSDLKLSYLSSRLLVLHEFTALCVATLAITVTAYFTSRETIPTATITAVNHSTASSTATAATTSVA